MIQTLGQHLHDVFLFFSGAGYALAFVWLLRSPPPPPPPPPAVPAKLTLIHTRRAA